MPQAGNGSLKTAVISRLCSRNKKVMGLRESRHELLYLSEAAETPQWFRALPDEKLTCSTSGLCSTSRSDFPNFH